MALAAGTRLGPYEIVATLGAGGMGEVYRAHDTRLGRDVALKVLPDLVADSPERLARFEREAKALAALNHPHIANIHGLEDSGGHRALVMELVEGATLAERLARGAIPLDEALSVAHQLAEALECAHEHGIVHRDLKPANIKLTPEGAVKVLDFGLARAFESAPSGADPGDSPTITSPAMTRAGVILGTAAYMSPEQARSATVDKRADIWAFGVVLFEMLTGRRLFDGASISDTLASVLRAEPEWGTLPPETPWRVRDLLHRCLAKDRNQRLHDIADARLEIEEVMSSGPAGGTAGSGLAVPRSKIASLRETAAWTLVVLCSLGALWLGWALGRRGAPAAVPATVRFTVPNVDQAYPATGSPFGYSPQFALSPDGRRLVLSVQDRGRTRLAIQALDMLAPRVLPSTEGASLPFWSPDGEHIAFFQNGLLRKLALATGGAETILPMALGLGGAWGSAGEIVATDVTGLWRVPAAGGKWERVRTPGNQAATADRFAFPSFLSDGRRFVVTHRTALSGWTIDLISLDGGAPRTLVRGYAAKVVGDSLVYLQDAGLFRQVFDPTTAALSGTPERLGAGEDAQGSLVGFDLASDGTLVYQRRGATELRWFDREGRPGDALALDPSCRSPELSPDGTHVAVECDEPKTSVLKLFPPRDVWTFDLSRNAALRLTSEEGHDESDPTWSPDGTRVVYASGGAALYAVAASGGGPPERLVGLPPEVYPTSWWPGRYLVYVEGRTYREQQEGSGVQWGDLYLLDRESRPRPLATSPFAEQQGQLSPDSKHLLYMSTETGDCEVYVKALDDAGKWRISTGGGYKPRWRPDGGEIFYLTADRTLMAVPVSRTRGFQPGQPTPLFKTRTAGPLCIGNLRYAYAVAQGGQRFLMCTGESSSSLTVVVNATSERTRSTTAPR